MFGKSGELLTMRLRSQTFSAMMRQVSIMFVIQNTYTVLYIMSLYKPFQTNVLHLYRQEILSLEWLWALINDVFAPFTGNGLV